MNTRAICVLLVGLSTACATPEPEHQGGVFDPASGDVVLPRTNPPLAARPSAVAIPAEAPVRRTLPQGRFPALLIVRENRNPIGDLSATGEITLSDGKFVIQPPDQPSVTVAFRPPPGMPKILALPATGVLNVANRSNPAGIFRQTVVLDPDGLPAVAEIAKASRKPVEVALGGGLRLAMTPTAADAQSAFEPVALTVLLGSRPLATVSQGETTTVRDGNHIWLVHPFVSLRQTIPDNVEGTGVQYILRAWVVAEYTTRSPQGLPPRFRKQ